MSGVLNALVAVANKAVVSVTLGSDGSARGFVSGSYGSVSPSSVLGETIQQAQEATVSGNFTLRLDGSIAQSAFRSIRIEKGAASGGYVTLDSSSATYTNPSSSSQWVWSSAGIGWLADDVATVRIVELLF